MELRFPTVVLLFLQLFVFGCAAHTHDSRNLESRVVALETKLGAIAHTLGISSQTVIGSSLAGSTESVPARSIEIGGSPISGSVDAPNTIVVFVDMTCSFCARYYSVLPQLVAKHPSKVRYVVKQFPLTVTDEAWPAAKVALAAAEQGKYAEMLALLFTNRRVLGGKTYQDLAGQIDLNTDQFTRDLLEKKEKFESQIRADIKLGKSLGVDGTPTFYLNGQLTDARDVEQFEQLLSL